MGPQQERSRLFSGEAQQQNARIDLLSFDKAAEKTAVEGELSRLRRENMSLRDSLQRSLCELKAYMTKFPTAYVAVNYDEGEQNISSPEVMTPLFEAYDARVKELEVIVGQQAEQLSAYQQKIETIVSENEELREAQLDNLRKIAMQSERFDGAGGSGFGPMGPLNAELMAEMNERVDILMAENALMVEQKFVLSTELDGHQQELQRRTEEVSTLSRQLMTTARELQSKSVRASQFEKERDEAAKKAMALSNSLGQLEGDREMLREQVVIWQQKCSDSDAIAQDLMKQQKQLSEKTDESATAFMRRTKVAEDRVKELHSQLLQKSHELDSAQEIARKLRREYQSTRQDAEGMLQVMSGLERQLSEYTSREAEVEKQARDSKDAVEEAMSARDQVD